MLLFWSSKCDLCYYFSMIFNHTWCFIWLAICPISFILSNEATSIISMKKWTSAYVAFWSSKCELCYYLFMIFYYTFCLIWLVMCLISFTLSNGATLIDIYEKGICAYDAFFGHRCVSCVIISLWFSMKQGVFLIVVWL